MNPSRVTLTKKANGRYYLGMGPLEAFALIRMLRNAQANRWHIQCMGNEEELSVQDAGRRVFGAAMDLERRVTSKENA